MMMEYKLERIYLSIGTNLGNRQLDLKTVKQELPPELKILEGSLVYQTETRGYLDQLDFLDQVFVGETFLSPSELLEYIKGIEKKIGRKQGIRFGPKIGLLILTIREQIFQYQTCCLMATSQV